MTATDENEEKKIMQASPRGTWALMAIVGVAMLVTWLFLYFGVFLSRGTVH